MSRFIIFFITLGLIACSSEPQTPDNRPGQGSEEETDTQFDYSPYLTQYKLLAELPTISLEYESGGIMYVSNSEQYSFIRVDDGVRIDFNPSAKTLTLNGSEMEVENVTKLQTKDNMAWYGVDICDCDKPAILIIEIE